MFGITYENEKYVQWSSEYIFNSFEEAKTYLLEKGFIEKNRIFVREKFNWSNNLKAYIIPRKIYRKIEV